MTEEKKIFCRKINELIGDIQAKDERKSVLYLEQTVFEKKGFISSAIATDGNPSIDKLRNIINGLEKYKIEMRDYSEMSVDDLDKKIRNLIENKRYNKAEVSELMGKSITYVNATLYRKSKPQLLDIFDFVTLLPKKKDDVKPAPPNLIPANKTNDLQKAINKNSGTIHVVKLAFGDAEYYLESVGESQIVFVKSSDRAQWFDETPEANLEFLTGRKKVVIEFD